MSDHAGAKYQEIGCRTPAIVQMEIALSAEEGWPGVLSELGGARDAEEAK